MDGYNNAVLAIIFLSAKTVPIKQCAYD